MRKNVPENSSEKENIKSDWNNKDRLSFQSLARTVRSVDKERDSIIMIKRKQNYNT